MTETTGETGRGLESVLAGALAGVAVVVLSVYEVIHFTGFSYGAGPSVYPVNGFDEGVYTETGALIAHGYKLYSQIYSAQPPLLPAALAIIERIFGAGLIQARGAMLIFGLLALLGAAGAAALARGRLAGGFAALLLLLSPEFLVYSHAVEEEIPMTALALLSLAFALAWRNRGGFDLAGASGLFFGLAMLTKFLALALLAPLFLVAVISAWDRRSRIAVLVRDVGLFLAAMLLPLVISLVLWGRQEWTQMINDRLGATAEQARFQQDSTVHLLRDLFGTDPGLFILAGVAAVIVLIRDWRLGVLLDSWLLATLVILWRYHPLFGHHLIILLAPAAILGGAGVSYLTSPWRSAESLASATRLSAVSRTTPRSTVMATAGLAAIAVVAYLALVPRLAGSYPDLLVSVQPADRQLGSIARQVAEATPAGSPVVAADPMICVLAHRYCVPQTVDASYVRVETGKLAAAAADTDRARAAAVVLGRALCLHPFMDGYVRWVRSHFRLKSVFGLDSKPECPWRNGPPVRPHWPGGLYVLPAVGR